MVGKTYRAAVAGAAMLGAVFLPAAAHATPGSGVSGTIISRTTIGDTDYILREITILPGGSTGWHYHDGTLYGLVKAGTLTHSDAGCMTEVYPEGHTIIEPSGGNHVHKGRNLGSKVLVLDVLYVNPAGSPLSEDAPDPGCGSP